MLDPYGPQMGFYMGQVRAAHMGVMWVLQQGSMLGPHGCSIWVQYGPHWGPIWNFPYPSHIILNTIDLVQLLVLVFNYEIFTRKMSNEQYYTIVVPFRSVS